MSAGSSSPPHSVSAMGSSTCGEEAAGILASKAQELMSTFMAKKEPSTYASLFQGNRVPMEKCLLEFVPVGEEMISIGFDEIETVETALGSCLVGCVVGRKLDGYIIKEVVRQWGKNIKFQAHETGWITFFFPNEEEKLRVLKGGPYLVFGRHLFLKEMPRCFLFRVEDMLMFPTWVQIHGLPADCWTPKALSKIASALGKPIHSDNLTMTKGKSKFARVLVELDATKARVFELPILLPTGVQATLRFVYETNPLFCMDCNMLGHSKATCNLNRRPDDGAKVVEEGTANRAFEGGGVEQRARSRSRNPGASRPRGGGHGRGQGGARGRGGGGARGRGDGHGRGGGRGNLGGIGDEVPVETPLINTDETVVSSEDETDIAKLKEEGSVFDVTPWW